MRNPVEVSFIELVVIHVSAQAIKYANNRFTFDSVEDIPLKVSRKMVAGCL